MSKGNYGTFTIIVAIADGSATIVSISLSPRKDVCILSSNKKTLMNPKNLRGLLSLHSSNERNPNSEDFKRLKTLHLIRSAIRVHSFLRVSEEILTIS